MTVLQGIDHIHVHVRDRAAAVKWYARVLDMQVVEKFRDWAKDGGPLTLEDPSGSIHLALFERESFTPMSAAAFRADAQNFLAWKERLEKAGLSLRCSDHDLAWSLYFSDPDGNAFEITSYEHEELRTALIG